MKDMTNTTNSMRVEKKYHFTSLRKSVEGEGEEINDWVSDVDVTVTEIVGEQYGLFSWSCAPLLSQFILHQQTTIRNKHILEIGCGTALPGITAAKLGARITLSDGHDFVNCRENCLAGVRANGVEVSWVHLTWGRVTKEIVDLPPIDFIIASDCFYDEKDFEDIMFTLAFLFDKNPTAIFWTSYQLRDCDYSIERLLTKWGMVCREISVSEFAVENDPNVSSAHDVRLFEIKKVL